MTVKTSRRFEELSKQFDREKYQKLTEKMSFPQYLDRVFDRPRLAYSAYQRLYSMIISAGTYNIERYRKTVTKYKFFNDPEIPIFGLEDTLGNLVKHVKGAASWHGTEKRILLLHGPVGSSKSTICRLLKRGLERYSQTDDGAIYTYTWTNLGEIKNDRGEVLFPALDIKDECKCPMNDDPLKLIPSYMRKEIQDRLNQINEEGSTTPEMKSTIYQIRLGGELNPQCDFYMTELLKRYNGDWGKVVENHIEVRRIVLSESKRVGIGTFQPKDPKNQDATELTGDINYTKLAHYGVDSDPRAFGFDGEFEVANRGFIEFIEVLKLEKEFLYDLLGVCQERQFKPKKFPQIDVDMVIVGHTNNPEFVKLQQDVTMEALRDRTVRVDVPYLLRWTDELKVLEQDYGKERVKNIHIAPHTLEIAALWAILTRLKDGKDNVSLVDKAKLYDGRSMPGWTEDRVKELRDKYADEGMSRGVSARYVQNKIANALVSNPGYVNMFMVLNEIKEGLGTFALIVDENDRQHYDNCIELVKKELDDILKKEVQRALVADENAITRLYTNYIDNVVAHVEKTKITDPFTGAEMEPDERLMRAIEEKADIGDQYADDFRRQIATYIGTQHMKGKEVRWDSNPKLAKALEKKLFEDTKDTIKLSALSKGATVGDKDLQEKIDAVKTRMIRNYGYNENSATDVLNYVASIFARGETSDN
jgi:serine protein kinase